MPSKSFPEPSIEYVSQRICNLTGHIAQPGCPDAETYTFPQNEVPPDIFTVDEGLPGSFAGGAANATGAVGSAPTAALADPGASSMTGPAALPRSPAVVPGAADGRPGVGPPGGTSAGPAVASPAARPTFTQQLRDAFSLGKRLPPAVSPPAGPKSASNDPLTLAPALGASAAPRTVPPD
jgi:hypothetical protein